MTPELLAGNKNNSDYFSRILWLTKASAGCIFCWSCFVVKISWWGEAENVCDGFHAHVLLSEKRCGQEVEAFLSSVANLEFFVWWLDSAFDDLREPAYPLCLHHSC